MTIQPRQIEPHAIISDEEAERIAALLFAKFQERLRKKAMRVRQSMLDDLRSFEDMWGLPRSIPTLREQGDRNGYVPKERDEG